MRSHTVGDIALRPTGNEQGGWHYLSLYTGQRLDCLKSTELPMPQDFIARVHTLARLNPPSGLDFRDRNKTPFGPDISDPEDSSDYQVSRLDSFHMDLPVNSLLDPSFR